MSSKCLYYFPRLSQPSANTSVASLSLNPTTSRRLSISRCFSISELIGRRNSSATASSYSRLIAVPALRAAAVLASTDDPSCPSESTASRRWRSPSWTGDTNGPHDKGSSGANSRTSLRKSRRLSRTSSMDRESRNRSSRSIGVLKADDNAMTSSERAPPPASSMKRTRARIVSKSWFPLTTPSTNDAASRVASICDKIFPTRSAWPFLVRSRRKVGLNHVTLPTRGPPTQPRQQRRLRVA